MKKIMQNRYPNTAALFQFCKMVLSEKYNNSRVIDQDIGQILDYDPADCSHWKKGRKNIKSVYAIKRLSEHLEVDENIIFDVVSGEMDLDEAYFEYFGYRNFSIDQDVKESARKEFYRKNPGSWSREKEEDFYNQYKIDRSKINAIIDEIYGRINFSEVPLYLPEVVSCYEDLDLEPTDELLPEVAKLTKVDDKRFVIRYKAGQMKAYVRYAIARELGNYFINKDKYLTSKVVTPTPVQEAENSLFAGKLLVPTKHLKKVVQNLSLKKDLLVQMTDIFWVSKTLISLRFKDYIENGD